jgi:hypothetical protein
VLREVNCQDNPSFVSGVQLIDKSGIGRAIAQYLINKSHNVVLLARSEGPLEELRVRYPEQVRTLASDISDPSVPKKAIEYTLKEFDSLDSLIINHGTLEPVGRVADSDVNSWRKGFDVNFFSAVAFVSMRCSVARDWLTLSRPKPLYPRFVRLVGALSSLLQVPPSMPTRAGGPMEQRKRP